MNTPSTSTLISSNSLQDKFSFDGSIRIPLTDKDEKEVEELRTWVSSQEKISCLLDNEYLSRFLRIRDFDQSKARDKLRASMRAKSLKPLWFGMLDTRASDIQAVLSSGYFIPLPGFNKLGQKVLIQRLGALDTSTSAYNSDSVIRATSSVTFHNLLNEKVQKQGLHYIVDCAHFSWRHKLYWSLDKLATMAKCADGFPARVKKVNVINAGYMIYMLYAIIKPFLPKNIITRIKMCSLSEVYQSLDYSILPKEYLPDDYIGSNAGSINDIMEKLKLDISKDAVRDRILLETDEKYGIH